MRLCLCLNWKEEKDRILEIYETMIIDEVIRSLGVDEKKSFDRESARVIEAIRDELKAIELTKE
jgi:hypothetical protein